jgi:hypothetical protein
LPRKRSNTAKLRNRPGIKSTSEGRNGPVVLSAGDGVPALFAAGEFVLTDAADAGGFGFGCASDVSETIEGLDCDDTVSELSIFSPCCIRQYPQVVTGKNLG